MFYEHFRFIIDTLNYQTRLVVQLVRDNAEMKDKLNKLTKK